MRSIGFLLSGTTNRCFRELNPPTAHSQSAGPLDFTLGLISLHISGLSVKKATCKNSKLEAPLHPGGLGVGGSNPLAPTNNPPKWHIKFVSKPVKIPERIS